MGELLNPPNVPTRDLFQILRCEKREREGGIPCPDFVHPTMGLAWRFMRLVSSLLMYAPAG